MFESRTFFNKEPSVGERALMPKIAKISCLVIVCILALCVAFVAYLQSSYISLRIFDKRIAAIEVIEYEKEPFRSGVKSGVIITDEAVLNSFSDDLNRQKIAPVVGTASPTVLFITFEDDTKMNAYYSDGKIGLNYGKVWLNVSNADVLTKQNQISSGN